MSTRRSVCQQHVTPLQHHAFLSLISLFICAILQKCFYKTTQLKTEKRKFQFVTARVVSAPDVVSVNVNEAGRVTRTVSERDARVKTDSAAKKLELSFNRALPLHRCAVPQLLIPSLWIQSPSFPAFPSWWVRLTLNSCFLWTWNNFKALPLKSCTCFWDELQCSVLVWFLYWSKPWFSLYLLQHFF